jgi:hypothetical protein
MTMKSTILLLSLCCLRLFGDDSIKSLDTIMVHGRPTERAKVNLDKIEQVVGKSDELNNLLYLQPSVARVPEAGSQMLVQGDGAYDNAYYVDDIPVFLLSQFSGQVFIDRSVISLTTANDLRLETQGIAGRYAGASGSVLSLTPTIPIGKGPEGMPFPELGLQYGTLGSDFTFKLPLHKIGNYYQITVRPANFYAIRVQDILYGAEPNIGLGIPSSFDNVQIHGVQKMSHCVVEEIALAGRDNYAAEMQASSLGVMGVKFTVREKSVPWGIFVASIKDTAPFSSWKLSVGGSRQEHFEGKLLGVYSPLVSVLRQNAAMCLESKPKLLQSSTSALSLRISADAAQWRGTIDVRREVTKSITTNTFFHSPVYHDSLSLTQNGNSGNCAAHVGYLKELRPDVSLEMDVAGGMFLAGMNGFFDPGLSLRFHRNSFSVWGQTGIVSSQPDIRGLPTDSYAGRVIHTFRGDITASEKIASWLTLSLNCYVKLKDHVPLKSITALSPVWDESSNARGKAIGGTLTVDAKALERLRLWSSMFLSRSTINGRDGVRSSDWEIPWTLKTALSYSLIKNFMRLYAIGTYAAGLPYHDLIDNGGRLVWNPTIRRVPPYKSVDLKCEFSYIIPKSEWHVREFGCYMLATNVTREKNIREYYWDEYLQRLPVTLAYGTYFMGARVVVWF